MSLYYADTSAVFKLLVEESNSNAFAAFYDAHADADGSVRRCRGRTHPDR